MEYKRKHNRPGKPTLRVKDRYRDSGQFVSRFIMPDEYEKLRPGMPVMRYDFKFNSQTCLIVEQDLAEYLKTKYPETIYFVDEQGNETRVPDEFTPIHHNKMMKVLGAYNRAAKEMGIAGFNMVGKTDELRDRCRELKEKGVVVDLVALGVVTADPDDADDSSEDEE